MQQMRTTQEVFIYDCNEADTYAWSHVPGAVLTVYDALSKEQLPADPKAILVFYCYSPECPAGASAAKTAASLGYVNVYNMPAGIVGWEDAGLPTEPKP
ncbi:MAG: rhodanese-like domain-containing protein [Flavobacteriales bacterium]